VIDALDLVALRPATPGIVTPEFIDDVVGKRLARDVEFHDMVTRELLI
jgi:sialic acid synthase SpsE